MYIYKKISEVIRGNILRCVGMVKKNVLIEKKIRMGKSVEISIRNNGSIFVGKNTIVNDRSVISAINGGELIISQGVNIGMNNVIACHKKIIIGKNTILGPNVLIYDHDHKFSVDEGVKKKEYNMSQVVIGENCWIGANTVILRGSIIGDNCVIGAGSVVKGIIDSGTVFVQKREKKI